MLNTLHIEKDRFYFGLSNIFKYGVLLPISLGFLAFSVAGFTGVLDDVPFMLSAIFGFIGGAFFIFLLFNALGLGPFKDFRSQPIWGADAQGVFIMTQEGRLSRYDWSRITKISIIDKITYRGDIDDMVIDDIYLYGLGGSSTPSKVTRRSVVIFHVDEMNAFETKIHRFISGRTSKDIRRIASSYSGSKPTEVTRLLKKYAPSDLEIERRQELKLNG